MAKDSDLMKDDALRMILFGGVCILSGIVIGLFAKTRYIEPHMVSRGIYRPTQMKCEEFDSNDIIIHGKIIKLTFLDPDQFKSKEGDSVNEENCSSHIVKPGNR